jgi:hypothetical protein
MESILNTLNKDLVERCLAGIPVDVTKFSPQQVQTAAILMAHCCLNGPVGVNKDTTFPEGLVGSIKSLMGLPGLSNKSWSNTCSIFAVELKKRYPVASNNCQQAQLNGDLWPLHGKSGTNSP